MGTERPACDAAGERDAISFAMLGRSMWVTILTVLEIVYVVGLSTWILLEKRSPVATVAWIVSLLALPYVGFVVFYFLGPRRLRRKRLRHARARAASRAVEAAPSDDEDEGALATEVQRLAVRAGGSPLATASCVELFHDAESCLSDIARAIDGAKHHVHVAYYILEPGESGTRLRDLLVKKAREGVTVRVLVDAVGSASISRRWLRPLRAAGGYFAFFNPVRFARLRSRLNFRNHRKIVVVDGSVAFTGGVNISDEYLPGRATAPWRDTHLRVEGNVVRWLQLVFFEDWHFATTYVPQEPEYFPPRTSGCEERTQIVAGGPDRDWESIKLVYFTAITQAHDRVWIATPYFVPDDAMLAAITSAAMRGVDVRILVPKASDSRVVTAAARSYYDEILRAGVRIFEYAPAMMHAKTLVVDDAFAAVGTPNFDNRSFRLNFEVTCLCYGERVAGELAEQFERDLAASHEVTAASRRATPRVERVAEASARVLSPLL